MKKRVLSWLLTLSLVLSLVPPIPVRAAARSSTTLKNEWPAQSALTSDTTDIEITASPFTPTRSITIGSGKTLIVHGSGSLSGATFDGPIFVVEDGGHLVLDNVTITSNSKVGNIGAVYVKSRGLLDLGYNDRHDRLAPGISDNTSGGTARNLVIEDGARVRLNNAATKKIGISYAGTVAAPVPLLEGGRYALTNDDLQYVVADDSKLGTTMELDTILLRYAKPQFLFLDTEAWFDIANGGVPEYALLNDWQKPVFTSAGAEVTDHTGNHQTPAYLTDAKVGNIMKYDVIMLCGFYRGSYTGAASSGKHDMNDEEYKLLEKFINNGGRVILQCEDASDATPFHSYINPVGSQIAQRLGAGFEITNMPNGHKVSIDDTTEMNVKKVPPLTDNVNQWRVGFASPIICTAGTVSRTIFDAKGSNGSYYSFCEDMQAGVRADGTKWGNIMALSDANLWTQTGGLNAHYGTSDMVTFAGNILGDSRSNRVYAALGYNPNNLQIEKQATTTTTETKKYATPYAALQKAVETNTVTLLTASNRTLTPTRDELLFEKSTLAYEAGSTYAGSTIHADTAGVYLDITKTGEVNLRDEAGTVTVTPKDADYVLTLGGTMDETGTQITGGITIKSGKKYTLNANDANSPILADNNGRASITAVSKGDTFTVSYPDSEVITYTAKNDGEVIYLGKYVVDYTTLSNNIVREYQDDDPRSHAHHGHDFTQHFTAADGFELKGQAIEVKTYTTDKANPTTYNMNQSTDTVPGVKTVYVSDEKDSEGKPKVVITQYHEQLGSALRNGKVTVTVRDVRENIIVTQKGDTTEAVDPIIYVVGVGKNGGTETPLWSYTTQRSGKDGQTTKSVDGWPWAKWKVSGVKTALGTEAEYKAGTLTNWTTGNLTIPTNASDIASYEISLLKGDTVVVFEYEWDMVEVKINAKLGTGPSDAVDFPNFTPQSAEVQRDVQSTILAPTIAGYQADQTSQLVTPMKNTATGKYEPEEVTFYYTLSSSTVLYRAVDAEGHELATWNGPRVIQGDPVSTDWSNAPKLAGYQVIQQAGVATAENNGTTDRFDGQNRITVTWKYEPKTRDVVIKMVEYTDSGNHRGQELRTDTQSYAKSPVGFTLNLTAPAIPGYTVKVDAGNDDISAGKTVFVEDTVSTDPITVYFYYEQDVDNSAAITVQLWDQTNSKEIYSYKVDGVNGVKTLIRVPTYQGYKSVNNQPVSIAPNDDIGYGVGVVRFNYVPDTIKVTVQLVDSSKTPNDDLKAKVPNYTFTYDVVRGKTLKLVAPSIYGYVLQSSQIGSAAPVENTPVVEVVTTEASVDQTVTFSYLPMDDPAEMININIAGKTAADAPLYSYTMQVTEGTASKDVPVFTVPRYELTGVTDRNTNKNAAEVAAIRAVGKYTVDTSTAHKNSQVNVVLTYTDKMVEVTVKGTYDGEELQSYKTLLEKGVAATVQAPSVPGYTANQPGQTYTPSGNNDVVEFIYTKDTGNVTVIAVDQKQQELYRKDGGTVAKDAPIALTGNAAAPDIQYYERTATPATVTVNNAAVANLTNYTYSGVGDIEVTYEYARKTQTVTVIKKDVDSGNEITINGQNQRQELTGLEVGKSHQFLADVTSPTGYTAEADRNLTAYFVEDGNNQTVTFWYRQNEGARYVTVTVNLKCDEDGDNTAETFQSYTVTAIRGAETTIKIPDMRGMGYKPVTGQKDWTGTPNDDTTVVEFVYELDGSQKTITVELVNTTPGGTALSVPTGYQTRYTLKKGEQITIQAPVLNGYSLVSATLQGTAQTNSQFVTVDYANGNQTVKFNYESITVAEFVEHTIKFVVVTKSPNGTTTASHPLYEHTKLIPKGTGTGTPVKYTENSITYLVPGFALEDISYADKQGTPIKADKVTDVVDAIITYSFSETAATIILKPYTESAGVEKPLTDKNVTLTGYRVGQTNVVVSAPALKDYALADALTKTLDEAAIGTSGLKASNEVKFKYESLGDIVFELYDVETNNLIAVKNGAANKTYNFNNTGDLLNLSASFYTYKKYIDSNDAEQTGASLTTGAATPGSRVIYKVYYEKAKRPVKYIAVDKTKLDDANTTLDIAIKNGAVDQYVINSLNPSSDTARVGESYKAIAQTFNGWTLHDDIFKMYNVEDLKETTGDPTPLKVYFQYVKKASNQVTVQYFSENAQGDLLGSYTIEAATGEDVTVNAPESLQDGKYLLNQSKTSQTLRVTETGTLTMEFYYDKNFVTVTTNSIANGITTPEGSYDVVKANPTLQIPAGTLTLYPPYKAGYTLVGITGVGNGTAATLPTGFNGSIELTNLTADTTITYYYKTTSASEYQTELTVKYLYNGYQLAADKTISVNRGQSNKIDVPSFDGYAAKQYQLETNAKVDITTVEQIVGQITVDIEQNAVRPMTLTITYIRPDGSVVLPGKDGEISAPHDEDNVIVKPDAPNGTISAPAQNGSVTVEGDGGTVTRPDPANPGKKEDVKVPEGTVVDKDGTIHLPGTTSPDGDIKPGNKLPENTPTGYITIIYQPNGGTGDVVKQLAKNDPTLKTIVNPFTAPSNATFNGWDTNAGGSGTNYAAGAPITGVTGKSLTLYAQWLKGEGTNVVTITYKPNGGTPNTDDEQRASDNTGTSFRMMLRLSSFTVPGWNFGGWNTNPNGSGDQYKPNTEVTVTMGKNWTLYAQWYRVNPDGSITVPGEDGNPNTPDNNATAKGDGKGKNPTRDPATGNIEIPKGGSVTIGDETISLPDGGILKPDGTVIINRPDGNGNVKPDGTITVPGKDGTTPDVKDESGNEVSPKPTVFTVTYQSNNGENKTAKSYAVANEDFTIMPSPFTYTGYTFLRWMKDTDIFYNAGQSVNATENLTLKAMWAKVNSDGSITVPGPDGRIETDNDNTTVNPNGNGDKPEFTDAPVPGSVKVPDGATVDTPTGPVIPPDGSVVLPDGTIVAPDNNGSVNPGETIYPDDKRPTDENNRTYFTVTYQSDIAGQSKVYQSARKADGVTVLANRFLTPNGMSFKGWKAGDGTTYQPGENLKSHSDVTLTAIYEQPTGVRLLTVDPPISSANQNSAIQLTAKKNSAATTDVNWTAQKLTGGNLNSAINASGRLTVPANAADGDIIIVTATDKTDPNLAASAYVAVNVPISVNPGGGSSGGTTTKTYTITATAGAHGSIDPEGGVSVKGGSDKVFTISPNNGYRIEEVRVDGRSVGTVSYYVFSNVDENHTISVTFAEARPANSNGIADPSETGVANWLRVTDHSAFMNGFGNGLFGPSDNITRAQTAQMFYNLLVNKDVPVTISFTDVADDAWCAEAVKTLASLGIVNGLGNGTFAPNRQITRAEFTVIATRFAKVNANATNTFTDVNPSDWYYSAISTAASYGWIAGMADGSFQPGAKITRAQAATIVNRMLARTCDRSFTGNVKTFVDVSTDHWAYYQIMEATNSHTHRYDADGYETWTGLN